MQGLGARLVEHGEDFEEARVEACRWAEAEGHHYVPSFHEWLVEGTATYSWELFGAVEGIDVAFVPIGMGSGILGMCAAREALGVKTEIVGWCRRTRGRTTNRLCGGKWWCRRRGRGWRMGWRFRRPMPPRWH